MGREMGDRWLIVDGTEGREMVKADFPCTCGDHADDHDTTDVEGEDDGILGQCFECPCPRFTPAYFANGRTELRRQRPSAVPGSDT